MGEKLEALKPEPIVICGVCTHICVLPTVIDVQDRGYTVEIPVDIVASGGLDPEHIRYFIYEEAPVDIFAVGSYISGAKPINFIADLHEVEGKPIAKRGKMPALS